MVSYIFSTICASFTFRSLINMEFIFLYCVRKKANFFFQMNYVNCLLNKLPFSQLTVMSSSIVSPCSQLDLFLDMILFLRSTALPCFQIQWTHSSGSQLWSTDQSQQNDPGAYWRRRLFRHAVPIPYLPNIYKLKTNSRLILNSNHVNFMYTVWELLFCISSKTPTMHVFQNFLINS